MLAHRATLLVTGALLLVGVGLNVAGADILWPAFLAMVAFYAVIFFVGASAARLKRGEGAEEMLLAGRSVPLWIGVFTMTATWVGGGYVNGTAESTAASGLAWVQAPWGYALSLILGGLFFARTMRRHRFTTMLDPLALRFGARTAAVLYLVALSGEMFWTAAILTALGTTFGTIMGIDFTTAILISAAVALAYTSLGGLWAVALTDVLQLVVLLAGLWLVVPVAAAHLGGVGAAWTQYVALKGELANPFPPLAGWRDPAWGAMYWVWWDSALLLIFGGIPWHVYFQRVLSARDENTAARLSIAAGFLCALAAVAPVLIGVVAAVTDWGALGVPPPPEPALTLPWVLRYLTGPVVATLGLGALAAAVMSSIDSSILSASSMAAWNVYRPLLDPQVDAARLGRVVRACIWLVGGAATVVALNVQSVYALWFLCSDFVYCILFPQLVTALFDRKANGIGSVAGLAVSFALRFGGGEPVLGLPTLLPFPMQEGVVVFPFRTLAMLSGLATIMLVSRLTARRSPPVPLPEPASA